MREHTLQTFDVPGGVDGSPRAILGTCLSCSWTDSAPTVGELQPKHALHQADAKAAKAAEIVAAERSAAVDDELGGLSDEDIDRVAERVARLLSPERF